MMTIADRAVLVTGANRGIGRALVDEALSRGVRRVYAGTRQPLAHPDGRVTPITGPTDTDMTRGFDIPKASAESVARAIFDGVDNGEEDIFPDPMSASMADSWRGGAAKALERENAALAQAATAQAESVTS